MAIMTIYVYPLDTQLKTLKSTFYPSKYVI